MQRMMALLPLIILLSSCVSENVSTTKMICISPGECIEMPDLSEPNVPQDRLDRYAADQAILTSSKIDIVRTLFADGADDFTNMPRGMLAWLPPTISD